MDGHSEVPQSDLAESCAVLELLLRECSRLAPWRDAELEAPLVTLRKLCGGEVDDAAGLG